MNSVKKRYLNLTRLNKKDTITVMLFNCLFPCMVVFFSR